MIQTVSSMYRFIVVGIVRGRKCFVVISFDILKKNVGEKRAIDEIGVEAPMSLWEIDEHCIWIVYPSWVEQ